MNGIICGYGKLRTLQKFMRKTGYNDLPSMKKCCLYPLSDVQPEIGNIAIVRNDNRTDYQKLQRCHNANACPVCAAHRSVVYANTITGIIKYMKKNGYSAIMVTTTIPHNRTDTAQAVVDRLMIAHSLFFDDKKRSDKRWMKQFDIGGRITSIECNYSYKNGYHFHHHTLLFVPNDRLTELADAEGSLKMKYIDAVKEAYTQTVLKYNIITPRNLDDVFGQMYSNGLTISRDENGELIKQKDGSYLTAELTTGYMKHTHSEESMNIFELINGKPADMARFLDYASAMKSMKKVKYTTSLKRLAAEEIEAEKKRYCQQSQYKQETICEFTDCTWYDINLVDDTIDDFSESEGEESFSLKEAILIEAFDNGVKGVIELLVSIGLIGEKDYTLSDGGNIVVGGDTPMMLRDLQRWRRCRYQQGTYREYKQQQGRQDESSPASK